MTATTARETLETLARERPDILLSEIELGDESGYALLAKVRSLPSDAGGNLPAAALSALSRTEDRVQSLLAGFQMHLSKPIQPAELLAAVACLAGQTRKP